MQINSKCNTGDGLLPLVWATHQDDFLALADTVMEIRYSGTFGNEASGPQQLTKLSLGVTTYLFYHAEAP